MNHRKAMPANGTRFKAKAMDFVPVVSHAPDSKGSAGIEIRNSTRTAIVSSEKMISAAAAALGVLKFA